MIDVNKKNKMLVLFGLNEDFSVDDLNSAYRTLAKLNHPDVRKNPQSSERMALVNEGYELLQAYYKERDELGTGKTEWHDHYYDYYKNAFQILKEAFEDYFGETKDKSKVGNISVLKKRLLIAKGGFSKLVNTLPYNQWVDDAIDKINSINKWLY